MLGQQRPQNPKCAECGKTVYPLEKVSALDTTFHKSCFKCEVCKTTLNANYKSSSVTGKLRPYCNVHCPKEKGTQIADSLHVKAALSAPKTKMESGIQKGRRNTFKLGETPEVEKLWTPASPKQIKKEDTTPVSVPQPNIPVVIESPIEPSIESPIEPSIESQIEPSIESQIEPPITQDIKPSVLDRANSAASLVPFLTGEETEMTALWELWTNSIPSIPVQLLVNISADVQQIHWETSGPKDLLESMTSFLLEVGAFPSEIELLRSKIQELNPTFVGSWIDTSARDGMDGGWKMITQKSIETAFPFIEGTPAKKITSWANKYQIPYLVIARDVGETIPRPFELRFSLPSDNSKQKVLEAWTDFGFPQIPQNFLELLESKGEWKLGVTSTDEFFVKISILIVPKDEKHLEEVCQAASVDRQKILEFGKKLGKETPDFIEFQHLMEGFGYGVYKEGFDPHFVYDDM